MISPVRGHNAHDGGSHRVTRTGSEISRSVSDMAAVAVAWSSFRFAPARALRAAASADRLCCAAAAAAASPSSSSSSPLPSAARRSLLRGHRFLGAVLAVLPDDAFICPSVGGETAL
jgi:hypothetical protein